nr:histone-lysine N-methyltransferase 2C isoform X4 [Nothobranchius furzeri]
MPSEPQSAEPWDRGPPPPVTRAGRNAQLAKAAAAVPASERRPRGRPRKDGSNDRFAPPSPPPPLPPPSKARKKGRSRGGVQVKDEESTGASEKSRPQNTGPKDMKAAGRRRSTPRTKPQTGPDLVPESSQDRLVLQPDPDPDPEPAVPEDSPEPAAGSEEDKTSPAPAALPPDPTPEVLPTSPSLDLRPEPDPAEEDRPSLNLTIMEVGCSVSSVVMETKGAGARPTEQIPTSSLHSSPPVSPCLRLEDDDDSLSPLFQRSPSEESGGSPTPSLGLTKKRLKQCAFCYRGNEPALGLGRLVVFGPTPGYIPLHILNRRTSSDQDNDCHDHCYHGNQAPPTCSSPEQCEAESSSEFTKQLGPIGLPHDISVQSLFDPTGQCCAHLQCAAWSEGVRQGEGQSLLYVDKAIDAGSTQVCAFCRQLGASLRCREAGCGRSYHFPCAAAAGANQDWNQRHTLCTKHAHTGSLECVLCADIAEPINLIMCCCCGNHYHGSCLDPPRTLSSLSRAGWQCPKCRVCCSCRLRDDEAVLLVCERCDKSYHTHCLTPPLEPVPSSSWTCKNCRVCHRCGVTSSGQWANHPFLCESCDPALPCPFCGQTPDLCTLEECLTCTTCFRSIHAECSNQIGKGRAGSESYVCSSCRPQELELISNSTSPGLPSVLPTKIPLSQNLMEAPTSSPSPHRTVRLITSDLPQTLVETICAPSIQIHTLPQPDLSELQGGPKSSFTDHQSSPSSKQRQYNLGQSPEDILGPRQSPSVVQDSSVLLLKDIDNSSAPSSLKHEKSSVSSPEEVNQCCAPSPKETHQNFSPISAKREHSCVPSPKVICQSLAFFPEEMKDGSLSSQEISQSLTLFTEKTHKSSVPPSKELHTNLATSLQKTHQRLQVSLQETHHSQATLLQEAHESPTALQKIHLSPTLFAKEINQSLTLSPTETHQIQMSPPKETHQSLTLSPTVTHQSPMSPPKETHQSLTLSPTVTHQSPMSPPKETYQSLTLSPKEMYQSPMSPPKETHQSLTLSPTVSHQSPMSPPKETHQSLTLSPTVSHQSAMSPPKETYQSLTLSPIVSHQSPLSPPKETHQTLTLSPKEMHESPMSPSKVTRQSLILSPNETYQSPAVSPKEPHQSLTLSPTVTHQIPMSPPKDTHQSLILSAKETYQSPAVSPKEPHQSLTLSPTVTHQIPMSPPKETYQSLTLSLKEMHRISMSPPKERYQSLTFSPKEMYQSPMSPPKETHQSQTMSPKEMHESPMSPPKVIQSLILSPKEIHHSLISPKEMLHTQSSPKKTHQSPTLPPKEIHQNLSSPKETYKSPASSPKVMHQNLLSLKELNQSLTSSPKEIHQSLMSSPKETYKSPAASLQDIHQSPTLSPKETHHSRTSLPKEMHQSLSSPKETYKSPAASLQDSHQSPASSPKKMHQNLSSPKETNLCLTSPEEMHQSPTSSPKEMHQSPTSSPKEMHQSLSSPKETYKSPAASLQDSHQSPASSPKKMHQNLSSPKETNLCLTSPEEMHQSPTSSQKEMHQSPTSFPKEMHQSPTSSPKEMHQSPTSSPKKMHQSPTSSPKEMHQSPTSSPKEMHQSPTSSPKEMHQNPTSSPKEMHQSPTSSPKEMHQSPTSSPKEMHQSPTSSPKEMHQSPTSSPKEMHQSPTSSPKEKRKVPVASLQDSHKSPTSFPKETHQCPPVSLQKSHQSSFLKETHHNPILFLKETHQNLDPSPYQCQVTKLCPQAPFPKDTYSSLAPSQNEMHQNQSSEKTYQNLDASPKLVQGVPTIFSVDNNTSPKLETYQSSFPFGTKTHKSIALSSDGVQQSPTSFVEETHESSSLEVPIKCLQTQASPHQHVVLSPSNFQPELSPEEIHPTIQQSPQNPAQSAEITQNCFTSLHVIQQNYAQCSVPSTNNVQQDPSSKCVEMSPDPYLTNIQEIPSPSPEEIDQITFLSCAEPERQSLKCLESINPSNPTAVEHKVSSSPSYPGQMIGSSSSVSRTDPTKLKELLSPPHPNFSEDQKRCPSFLLSQERSTWIQPDLTEFKLGQMSSPSPAQLNQSPTHKTSAQIQSSPCQLSSSGSRQNPTENERSPVHAMTVLFPLLHSAQDSPPQSVSQTGLSPTNVKPGLAECGNSQLSRSCGPTSIFLSQPHHHSSNPHNPSQVETSSNSSTPRTEPKLALEINGSDPAQEPSTIDLDGPHAKCSCTTTPPKSSSAPCSPSPPPSRASLRSRSQPGSPVQQLCDEGVGLSVATTEPISHSFEQTLEHKPPILSITSDQSVVPLTESGSDHPSPPLVPAHLTPESLDHSSTSMEHSSLNVSPCVQDTEVHQSPHGSPSGSAKAFELVDEMQAEPTLSETAFCLGACENPKPTQAIPPTQSDYSTEPSSPNRPESDLAQPAQAFPSQDETMKVHPNSPVYAGAISYPALSLSQAVVSSTHVQSFCSPSSGPLHFSPTHAGPASTFVSHNLSQILSNGESQMSSAFASHSPPRSSPAGQASPVDVVHARSPSPVTQVRPPHSPAQGFDLQFSPTRKPHPPAHSTKTNTGLTGEDWNPSLNPDVVLVASPTSQCSDIVAHLDTSIFKPSEPGPHVSQMQTLPTSAVCLISAGPEIDGSLSPSHQRPECLAQTTLGYASPTSPASPFCSTQSQLSPLQRVLSSIHTSTTYSISGASPTSGSVDSVGQAPFSSIQPQPSPNTEPDHFSPGPASVSGLQPERSPCVDSGPVSPSQHKPSPLPVNPMQPQPSPNLANLSPSLDFGPVSPKQLDSGPGIGGASSISCEVSPVPTSPAQPGSRPSQQTGRQMERAVTGEVHVFDEQRSTEEEKTRREPHQGALESSGDEEEDQLVLVYSPSGVQPTAPLLPLLASPSHQPFTPSCSSSHPPPPCTSSSGTPPHGTSLPPDSEEKVELNNSQSQSMIESVFIPTLLSEDEHQSHVEPSEKQEEVTPDHVVAEQQPIREKQEEVGLVKNQLDKEEEPPVSPVLDLDPSLDKEVMELMTPPSILELTSTSPPPFGRRGKGRCLRPPLSFSRPSDDLSIRLRQSPFSTEASPETSPARTPITPPPLTPPSPATPRESPPLSQAPPTCVFPLTPKIGMGKPAISKRKFSPGRARVRQGSWWSSRRALSPPSSSQHSTGEGGSDSPKPRPPDSFLWNMKVGRGSGFPGRRRSRGGGVGGGRGGRGRSRLKNQDSLTVPPGGGYMEVFQSKEEEENSMHNTVVMFSTSDHFTLKQDMCVVCGSFGQGAESRLLACSQCGQCYHPYCVNVKITRVVLTKGWRCLECTVCEACGDASDPGRLLLCDDCDISYHTYCLDPPLHTVPKGGWKCHWCVWCVQCGSASPGVHCDWQNNYSLCGPCFSLSQCPVCQRRYIQDELILQCQQCDRWVHAVCQGLTSQEDVELAAEEGFDCSLCRTHRRSSCGRSEGLGPYMAQVISRTRDLDSKTYTQDGVCLTESGLSHLQSLVKPLMSPRRNRRCKPKLKLRIINQVVSVLHTPPDPETPTDPDQNRGDLDCDLKSDSSPERDSTHISDISKYSEVTDGNKKKKRKPYRPGIGGFMVRQRGGKAALSRKDSMDMMLSRDQGVLDAEVSMETTCPSDQVTEKGKKRYRKKKTKLEEVFPSYLQEAFFGRDLLHYSRHTDVRVGTEVPACSQSGTALSGTKGSTHKLLSEQLAGAMATSRKPAVSEEALVDLSHVLNTDPHILATGHTESCGRSQRASQEEPLDVILSPELDKMVSDGAILSRLYNIPELKGKDVEEVFTSVLSPNGNIDPEPNRTHTTATPTFPRLPLMNGLMSASHHPNTPTTSILASAPAGFRVSPPQGPSPTSATANRPAAADVEQDALSTAQRSMLKWEKEESLGELATVAPVLYCNTNFPQLRQQYPDWSARVKQIAKLWRKASSQDRAPYVQKARDNRAAQRINKVQMSNDSLKHLQPPPQPPQPLGPYEQVSMEMEMAFKDPLRPRESEQEQEWKLRQQMRQKSKQLAKMEATQKLEQVKHEQRQQQLRLSGRVSPEAVTAHQPVAVGNLSPQKLPSSRHLLLQQGGVELASEVFLRPLAPPPSGFSSLPQSPHTSSPLHQPPSSPLMFSPPSSRPSSPWDPYSKGVGTPRSSSSQSGSTSALPQQRLPSLSSSPAHDALGSPVPSPDFKSFDTSHPGLQQNRVGITGPLSGSAPDLSIKPAGLRLAETYQRTTLRAPESALVQGGVFKAPMPPQQEVGGGGRRELSRPPDLGFSLEPSFPSSPLSSLGSPHRSPYAQTPDPLPPQSPRSSRPSPDPYSNPQTPGTPRSHQDSAYHTTPPLLRPDQYNQQPSSRRPSPSHQPADSYASNPGTPLPTERFPCSPGVARPSPDPYLQQPSTPRILKAHESLTQPTSSSSPLASGPSAEVGTFSQPSPRQQQDLFPRTSSSQKHPGMSEEASFSAHSVGHLAPGAPQLEKTSDQVALGGSSLEGAISVLPQAGDSEERLRQRQWLRQHILRQQHQKNIQRQEKVLQEPTSGPAAALHSWLPEDSSAPSADSFGRPPPPYPGTVRPPAPGFPGCFPVEQHRAFPRAEAAVPRQNRPPDLGVRGMAVRFGVPPAPPQGPPPGPVVGSVEGNPVQMRRPVPSAFSCIRPVMPPNAHMLSGVPQPFLPRPPSVRQHSVTPYIELRHRGPESRLRMPFPLPDPDVPLLHPTQPASVHLGPAGTGVSSLGPQAVLTHSSEVAQPGPDGMEEHLEGEDSAVKDLEDVEVKDLVDLNLNLDPDDGKEDLDLHLDDFLLSGKFDLIAYADPELNLEDKKDMFNEELDLGDPEDKDGGGASKKMDSHSHQGDQVKQEVSDAVKPEGGSHPCEAPAPGVLKEQLEGSASAAGAVRATQDQAPRTHSPTSAGQQSVFQQHQRLFGPTSSSNPPSATPPPQPSHQNSRTESPHPGTSTQNHNKSRPLLLVEQPLLIQDLLDKERQEQQQQKQMQALIRQRSGSESDLSSVDFDSIPDPIMKAKMVALKGINKVMSQGNLGLGPMTISRFQHVPGDPSPEAPPPPPPPAGQEKKISPHVVRRNPPSFGASFSNESQRHQYEEWLGETQQLLQMQQHLLEDQLAAHRKAKKALSAKQRTAKRAGRAFAEEDAAQLRSISEQQGAVQKQLEQIRKQQKDHSELIDDYRNKQQLRLQQMPPQKPLPQPHPNPPAQPPKNPLAAPMVPLQHQPDRPAAAFTPNAGWTSGVGAPGPMGQRPPPALPNNLQDPQNPPSVVPALAAFPTDPRGPSADGATLTPQVKFDDNNPFSEGFQERERRERLREQQERQRVQLMQEVERHRALQQRLVQQDLLGVSLGPESGATGPPSAGAVSRVTQTPGPGSGALVRMDFLQSSSASRPPTQVQTLMGAPFPSSASLHHGSTGAPLYPAPGLLPGAVVEPGSALQTKPKPACPGGPGQRLGHESNSSSPLSSSFPCASSGGSSSHLQLYSDIVLDGKPKKSRRRDGDDAGGGATTPLSPHSDITAPPTPAVSETSGSLPTHQLDLSFSGLAPVSELERQLSVRGPVLDLEGQRGPRSAAQLEVKVEQVEAGSCGGGMVKMEVDGAASSPLQSGDVGKELLRHLLKDKTSPLTALTAARQAHPIAHRQLSSDSLRSEEEEPGSHGNMVMTGPGPDRKKTQRCKRLAHPDRAPPKCKRRKREEEMEEMEEEKILLSSDPFIAHLRQLSILPLMEPVLAVDLSLFPPYGSSSLGRDSRLSGSFGNASLDGTSDYYSQLIFKQNNLINPPTPPASLPPTPPPVARQKLVNGFATTEEMTRKDICEQEVKGVSAPKHKEEELQHLRHISKAVDVPASLPTPPHNNLEELRVQSTEELDSPDGYVPSSSPESVVDMEVSRYPDLSSIKLEPCSPCPSPTLPIMPCAWGKGSAVKQEVKAEPKHPVHPSCPNRDLVTIAITVNPVAAQNVAGVMAAVATLLRVPGPLTYQLSRATGPEQSSLALLAGVRVPLMQDSGPRGPQRAPPAAGNQSQFCCRCKALLRNAVHLKQGGESRTGPSLVFCSPSCLALYQSEHQNQSTGCKTTDPGSEQVPPSRTQHQYTNNMSSITVHSLTHTPTPPPSSSSPPLTFPPAYAVAMETRPHMDSLKVKVKLKPHPRAMPGGDDSPFSRHGKRMRSSRWRRWSVSITLSRGPCLPNEAVAVPTEEEVDHLLKKLGTCLRPDPLPKDQRKCCFCHQQGDGQTDGPARLLNLDLDLWVHLNCALWSSEVYETQAGALINVELALRRGLTLRCVHCQKTGATTGCNRLRCTNTYHFTCALQAHCTFFKDKTMLCHVHKPRCLPFSGDRSSSCSPSSTPGPISDPVPFRDPYDSELRCFAVFRRVFVQRDEARQIAAVVQRGERQHTFRVGSLLFRAVGRLLPQQMSSFHNQMAIFPVGYHANRFYWSMRHSNRRCKYVCSIEEEEGRPLFKVKVVEKGHEDVVLTGATPKAVWDQILEPVAQMRSSSGTLKLFPVYLKGEDLFGLTSSAVTRIIESLPGVETCERYTFRYGRNPLMEWPLAFNPSGSARSEPKACQAKRPYLLTSVAPRCQGSVGSIVGLVPGVLSLSPGESVAGAHQGRHSKSAQYRRMKAEWKSNVYLARSRIQGLGLYATRDIEKCTMVIEYIGTIIRSEVANRKERLYESQNRGVYMFRIDNDYVIDATITGGPARYINHSCAPNCITEVVTVERENKIIISSCRRIQRGEELCYDYKFDLEDDQHKIPCHCGAMNCRKWMN